MKNAFKLLLIICAPLIMACGLTTNASSPATSTRTIVFDRPFNSLSVCNGIEVEYSQNSETPRAIVTARGASADLLEWIIQDGCLVLSRKSSDRKVAIKVELNGKALENISVSSSAILNITTPVKINGDFGAQASSLGQINFKRAVETTGLLGLQASSTARITFSADILAGSTASLAASSNARIIFTSLKARLGRFSVASTATVTGKECSADELYLAAASNADIAIDRATGSQFNIAGASAGNITVKNCTANNCTALAASSSEVKIENAKIDTLECQAASTGTILVTGKCTKGIFQAASMGTVDIARLQTSNSKVTFSSMGKVLQ